MTDDRFVAVVTRRNTAGKVSSQVEECRRSQLATDGVLVRVECSSLNFKDALAATGKAGIAKTFPHIPGIDAAGVVLESRDPRFKAGDRVFTTGHEIGVERWGGWSQLINVPADWLFQLPAEISFDDVMTLGTAGFTAAQCVDALMHHGVAPGGLPVVVTGATGGVGCLSVLLLAQLGFQVMAVTGKADQHEWLKSLGAIEVDGRELLEPQSRPLLSAKYAGAIDTVGGQPLASLSKMIQHRGCIACCGLTAGTDLPLTVYPFLLRGLTLCGIDSAWCPDPERTEIWRKLFGEWRVRGLEQVRRAAVLSDMDTEVPRMLAGGNVGRVVVSSRK